MDDDLGGTPAVDAEDRRRIHWIERRIDLPIPATAAYPLAVEPGTIDRWLVQVREVRPRGFLNFAPRVRHGGVSMDMEAAVVRAVVPEIAELDVHWRTVTARLVLLFAPTPTGCTVTMRIGLDLPPTIRLARHGIAVELSRLMLVALRRLRRLAREEALVGAAAPTEEDEDALDDEDDAPFDAELPVEPDDAPPSAPLP